MTHNALKKIPRIGFPAPPVPKYFGKTTFIFQRFSVNYSFVADLEVAKIPLHLK